MAIFVQEIATISPLLFILPFALTQEGHIFIPAADRLHSDHRGEGVQNSLGGHPTARPPIGLPSGCLDPKTDIRPWDWIPLLNNPCSSLSGPKCPKKDKSSQVTQVTILLIWKEK